MRAAPMVGARAAMCTIALLSTPAPRPALLGAPALRPHACRVHAPLMAGAQKPTPGGQKSLADLKVYELKAVCRAKGLKVSGRKAELIARIEAVARSNMQNATAPAPPSPAPADSAPSDPPSAPPKPSKKSGRAKPAIATAATLPRVERLDSAALTTNGAGPVESEVLSEESAEAIDFERWRRRRRSERREKLASYFSEEYTKVVGALEQAAGAAYKLALGGIADADEFAPPGADEVGGVVLPAVQAQMGRAEAAGRRLAWCRAFDPSAGTGQIVDLIDRTEHAVDRAALSSEVPSPSRDCIPISRSQIEMMKSEMRPCDRLCHVSSAVCRWPSVTACSSRASSSSTTPRRPTTPGGCRGFRDGRSCARRSTLYRPTARLRLQSSSSSMWVASWRSIMLDTAYAHTHTHTRSYSQTHIYAQIAEQHARPHHQPPGVAVTAAARAATRF